MKRFSLLFAALFVVAAFVGCDTNDGDRDFDADVVGTWDASRASVLFAGFSVPVFEAGDSGELSVTFAADGAFTFVAAGPIELDPPTEDPFVVLAEGEGATVTGEYSFDASASLITFNPSEVDGQPIEAPLTAPLAIEFQDADTVVITVDNTDEGRALLTALLGDEVPQEIIDNIDGGEVTFRRDS